MLVRMSCRFQIADGVDLELALFSVTVLYGVGDLCFAKKIKFMNPVEVLCRCVKSGIPSSEVNVA